MRKLILAVARLALGSIFLVYGLDGFLHLVPKTLASERATRFIGAVLDSGYLWTLLKVGETVGGALLIADLFVPLALVILAPIVVNILCFHLFLNPGDKVIGVYPIGVIIAVLELSLAWFYREYFQGLFVAKATVLEATTSEVTVSESSDAASTDTAQRTNSA